MGDQRKTSLEGEDLDMQETSEVRMRGSNSRRLRLQDVTVGLIPAGQVDGRRRRAEARRNPRRTQVVVKCLHYAGGYIVCM